MINEWAIVILALLGAWVRVGLMVYAAGVARARAASSALVRQLLDICVSVLAFWAVGLAIVLYTGNPVVGVDVRLLVGWSTPAGSDALVYLLGVLLAGGVVVIAMGERSRLMTVPVSAGVMGGVVVPVAAYWMWRGWLAELGVIDAAGAGVIHVTGGAMAAVGAWLVGPRNNKYNRDGSSNMILGHSVPLSLVGVGLMSLTWGAYVLAFAAQRGNAALVPMNVLLGGAAGALAACGYGYLRTGRVDPHLCAVGLMSGLVAVTGGAPFFGTSAAVLSGVVAGVIVPYVGMVLDTRYRLDDSGSVVAIHGVGGIWGLVAAGVFSPGSMGDRAIAAGVQAFAAVVLIAWAAGMGLAVFGTLKAAARLRIREADEFDGPDLSEHDVNAYPDFHQTMIKSYHLREA